MHVANDSYLIHKQIHTKETGGMFYLSYFDNSKVIMFDDGTVSYLRIFFVIIWPNT